MNASPSAGASGSGAPARAGLILATLIGVAAVANLNLAVANVALPDIGKDLDASQVSLNLIAVGYSLGLAGSVLYLGALGDRHGRKMMLILGMTLSVPASLMAGFANDETVLFVARLIGGVAAGMAYPTTLALITALWAGPQRTRAIALWSAIGGAIVAFGPALAGLLLESYDWGSVFFVTVPLAVLALIAAAKFVPGHVNETTEQVDNIGGILSVIMIIGIVLAINFAPDNGEGMIVLVGTVVGVIAAALFLMRQRRAPNPLYDLDVAGRPTFWVAALAGIIVFGSLMGAMFIGQQYLQDVLEYSTLDSGLAILPAALFMVLVAPRSAKLVNSHGARITLLIGYLFCLLGFLTMLILWQDNSPYWQVALAYAFMGTGVGFAGTPASHSLTGSVPRKRAGMASGTADLQRDLGGAIMQSIFGALLTAGYVKEFNSEIAGAPNSSQIAESTQSQLTKSFAGAAQVAEQHPQYAPQIVHAAQTSFLQGSDWAYAAGVFAVLIGAAIVFFLFPKAEREQQLLESYQAQDGD